MDQFFKPDQIVVVGGGLAGCCAALALSRHADVTLVDDGRRQSASIAGAGLVNPLLGRQAKRVWRADEALAAFDALIDDVGAHDVVSRRPVLRPAGDERQAQRFRDAADRSPHLGTWLDAAESARRYPGIPAPLGSLLVAGSAVRIDLLLDRIADVLASRGVKVLSDHRVGEWHEEPAYVEALLTDGSILRGPRLVLCLGASALDRPEFRGLNLHAVKGQTVNVVLPKDVADWPHVSGKAYLAVFDDRIMIGSTWEHVFDDDRPTDAATADILRRASATTPAIKHADIRSVRAGIRVTVPRSYLPMVGPLPGAERTWIFTGLGSKGLLMAPLIANALFGFMSGQTSIPAEIAVR